MKLRRNDKCLCGSGKKFKKCCEGDESNMYKKQALSELRIITFKKVSFPTQEEFDNLKPYEGDTHGEVVIKGRSDEEIVRNIIAERILRQEASERKIEGPTDFSFDDIRKESDISFCDDGIIETTNGYAYVFDFDSDKVCVWNILNDIKRFYDNNYSTVEEGAYYYNPQINDLVKFEGVKPPVS